MKKLFMIFGFLMLLCSMLSARKMFDGNVIFTSHDTAKDSLYYLIVEKAGGVLDTVMEIDTLGNVRMYAVLEADSFVGAGVGDTVEYARKGVSNFELRDTILVIGDSDADTSDILVDAGGYMFYRAKGGYHVFYTYPSAWGTVKAGSYYANGGYYTSTSSLGGLIFSGYNPILRPHHIAGSYFVGLQSTLGSVVYLMASETDTITADSSGNITGVSGYEGDSLNIGNEEWLKKLDFGSNVFGDSKTADTVLISGATVNDLYLVTAKDSIPAGYWTTIAKPETLIINSSAAEDDTPFIWWRFK